MSDVVVTLPKRFGLKQWVEEGDAAGASANLSLFKIYNYYWKVPSVPDIQEGERVYVVYDKHLIGYAPLTGIVVSRNGVFLVRQSGAEAVTIEQRIPGFRGYRYRWWDREDERPFPEWKEMA